MSKNNMKRDLSPEINEGLSCDDLDALLKFPYDQYLNTKQEENEVEALNNFVLNHDAEVNQDTEEAWENVIVSDQEDVKTATSCLSMNKNLQYKVNRLLGKVQNALEKNKSKQVEVTNYLEAGDYRTQFDMKIKTSKPISLFASPYFRDVRGMVPPENEDTLMKRANHDVTAYLQPPRPWMLYEKHALLNAVYSHCLSYILKPHKTKRNYLRDKLKDEVKNMTVFEETLLKKQIKEKEKEINRICRRPHNEIIAEAKDHIKWHEIVLDGNRDGEECEMMWENYLSIFINKVPFTPAEDEKLRQLVEKHDAKNWDVIAEQLQTKRSAIQCFERYQKYLNKALRKKYWTPEEDAKLLHIVESNRIGSFIPWNIVCSQMVGRERHQIINRYERTINNLNKRTPWTKEEDAMLLMCVKKFGCHWTKMKEYIPGRNPYNIRERYVNILDPYIICGPWTKAEDVNLKKLVKEYGYGKWSVIAKGVPGRTDNMCLIRANYLGLKPPRKNKKNEELSNESDGKVPKRRRRAPRTAAKPSTRLKIQSEALATLKAALAKIAPSVVDEAKETINVPSIHVALLKELHKELYKNENKDVSTCWKPRYLSRDGVSKIDFSKQKRYIPKRKNHKVKQKVIEEGEDIENFSDIDETPFSNEEILWLHHVLMSQFREAANLLKLPAYMKNISLNARQAAECEIYETYLKLKLNCSDVEVHEEDFIFGENNFNLTLADVVHHFIQPPVLEGSSMILCPNWTTLYALDIIHISEKRLHRTGKFIHQSVPYVRYLTGRTNVYPKCIKCCITENNGTDDMKFGISQLKANFIVPDEDMRISTLVENRKLYAQDQKCCCIELANSKAAVDLLTKRFACLFLWPCLMSLTNISAEQETLLVRNKESEDGHKKQLSTKSYPIPKKRRLNGRKKPAKLMVKKEESEITTAMAVSPQVKRNRQSSTDSPRKVKVKRERYVDDSESDSKKEYVNSSIPSSGTPLRRSQRTAVLQRQSFAYIETKDEESS